MSNSDTTTQVQNLSLRGRRFESNIQLSQMPIDTVRIRVHDIKENREGKITICFISENFHFITYTGYPRGSFTPVMDSWFDVSQNDIHKSVDDFVIHGDEFVINNSHFIAVKNNDPIKPSPSLIVKS